MPSNSTGTIEIWRDATGLALINLSPQETGARVRQIQAPNTTVELPISLPTNGDRYEVQDADGSASLTNQLVIVPPTGTTIRGGASFALTGAFESARVTFDAATDDWIVAVTASAGGSGGIVRSVPTVVPALRALVPFTTFESVDVSVYSTPGDGGGGQFTWNPLDVRADDGGTIIKVATIAIGRWNRVYASPLSPRWYGAKGDGLTDDTAAIDRMLAFMTSQGGGDAYFEEGTYLRTTPLNAPVHGSLRGAGQTSVITLTVLGNVIQSIHPLNASTTADVLIEDLATSNRVTFNGLAAAGRLTAYNVGDHAATAGRVVLECTQAGVTGAFRPIGQLTWIPGGATPAGYNGPAVIVSGAPNALYSLLIWLTDPTHFRWSLDNGATWSANTAIGAGVAITGTGMSITFGAGVYTANSFCAAPVFGFSLMNGTVITDGTVQWTIRDGGAGFCDVGGTFVKLKNFYSLGCWSGIIFDQTEVATIDDVSIVSPGGGSAAGYAGIWLCSGITHTLGADYSFTTAIHVNGSNSINGFQFPIVDDGGQLHSFDGIQVFNGLNWASLAGIVGVGLLSGITIEGSGAGLVGRNEQQLPSVTALGAPATAQSFETVGFIETLSLDGISTSGSSILSIQQAGAIAVFSAKGCLSDTTLFVGMHTGCFLFNDLGNFGLLGADIVDAEPIQGSAHLCSEANHLFFAGVGVGTKPVLGFTNAQGNTAIPSFFAAGSISTAATNIDVPIDRPEVYEVRTTSLSAAAAWAIAGFVNTQSFAGSVEGRNGQRIELQNLSGQTGTLLHQSGTEPTAARRIFCPGNIDLAIPDGSVVSLSYSNTKGGWLVTADESVASANFKQAQGNTGSATPTVTVTTAGITKAKSGAMLVTASVCGETGIGTVVTGQLLRDATPIGGAANMTSVGVNGTFSLPLTFVDTAPDAAAHTYQLKVTTAAVNMFVGATSAQISVVEL